MSQLFQILLIINIGFILCITSNLIVKPYNGNVVKQKRLDTIEMCRIFNAEFKDQQSRRVDKYKVKSDRFKRQLSDDYVQDKSKVLNKVQDDNAIEDNDKINFINMKEKHVKFEGHNLNQETTQCSTKKFASDYTHNEISSTTSYPALMTTDFAPKELLGPQTEPDVHTDSSKEHETVDWPKRWKYGIIPYYIDSKTYDIHLSRIIIDAFAYFEKTTCVRLQRLRERPTDQASLTDVDWIYITNPTGIRQCVHSNDQKNISGVQMVVFGYDCMSQGEILHEVMHVLGFPHEHVRSDRDKYIEIVWDNIKPGYMKYFVARQNNALSHMAYDYYSVMHYPPRAFSKNGRVTIVAQSDKKIGQREKLSEMDSEKVNYVYSAECLKRNKNYLMKTCPTVINSNIKKTIMIVTPMESITEYFKNRVWPFGIINYKYRDLMEFTLEERQNIESVIKHIQSVTCIQFRNVDTDHPTSNDNDKKSPREEYTQALTENKDKPYNVDNTKLLQTENIENIDQHGNIYGRRHANNILMLVRTDESGCKCPKPGRSDGNEILNITSDCFNTVNDLLHLFVHVLGLDHQHNMYDRDDYLHIEWTNLSPEINLELKNKLPPEASVGFSYDYQSVMHYPWLQIKNGVSNIMYPIWNDGWIMGNWQGLSLVDVEKIRTIYSDECQKRLRQDNS